MTHHRVGASGIELVCCVGYSLGRIAEVLRLNDAEGNLLHGPDVAFVEFTDGGAHELPAVR